MTVVNFNYPKFKYTIASTGQPGAGYKLFTYEEGTSTKKTTWTSLAKTGANTNPIILDANGEADVWIDGDYKFVLAPPTDTDPPTSPVWTYDAVRSYDPPLISASSSGKVPANGSFEADTNADGIPDDWTVAAYTGGSVSLDTTTQSHGDTCLKFTSAGSGGGYATTNDFYEVEAGKAVGVRFSLISADATTLNKVQVYWYNSAQTYLSTSDAYNNGATNPTSWTRQYTSVTAPATAKFAKVRIIGVDPTSSTHSTTRFDNVEFDTSFSGELPSGLKDVTASAAELNILDGVTATTGEVNYLSGVTSAIQTQIDSITTSGGLFRTVQIFTANGTYTKPAGLKRAKVTAIGGGGAGGGVDTNGGAGYVYGIGGGGGGGGGWAIKVLEAGSIGATETVTIGAGGTGVSGGTGNTGGTTSLGALCVAAGGVGGVAGLVGVGGAGGNGGLGTTGDAVGYGSDGTRGFDDILGSRSGEGGASILGGVRQGVAGVSATGNAGRTYGGGGSGAFNSTLSLYTGGAGAAGIIIVEEFY